MEKDKIWNIRERTFEYSLKAVEIFRCIQNIHDEAARIIGKQFLRSATSIGANIEEAHAAESNADFIHKYSIAQKEARESHYWLRLMGRTISLPEGMIDNLTCEMNEITAIIVNTKQNKAKLKKSL